MVTTTAKAESTKIPLDLHIAQGEGMSEEEMTMATVIAEIVTTTAEEREMTSTMTEEIGKEDKDLILTTLGVPAPRTRKVETSAEVATTTEEVHTMAVRITTTKKAQADLVPEVID